MYLHWILGIMTGIILYYNLENAYYCSMFFYKAIHELDV